MTPHRFQEVDRLLQLALSQPPASRDAFLRSACSGDRDLEAEVRSLLASHEQAGVFLERPAMEVAARALAGEGIEPEPDLTGRTISHYRILERLGGGGMGVVYKAEDTRLRRFVALKVVSAEFVGDPDALKRFEREARAASALNHPNICIVHDVGEENGHPFLVMECLEGCTLREYVAGRPLDTPRLVQLGIEIADALDAAHKAGIVHRDIKPTNIFITTLGHAKVFDFGLTRLLSEAPLTRPGVVVGTPLYMPPEQASGLSPDARADLFAFGLVLYEMATGRPPTAGLRLDGLAPKVGRIVAKCLEKERGQRYQQASEVRADLERLADSPLRNRWWKLLAAGGMVAALVAGYFYFYVHRAPRPIAVAKPAPVPVLIVEKKSMPEPTKATRPPAKSAAVSAAPKTKVNPPDGLTYVWIPPGKFTMGCSPGDDGCDDGEKPAHEVTLKKGFWIGQTEVTQAAYQRVMGRNPSAHAGPDLPVDSVRWPLAWNYCSAAGMRLPTEAEWEYAARGGSSDARNTALSEMAWWHGNSERQSHPVGQKQANPSGLYDMLGNLAEWTADWYGPYSADAAVDPTGPREGEYRVVRGGSWMGGPANNRVSSRTGRRPMVAGDYLGFRCAGN